MKLIFGSFLIFWTLCQNGSASRILLLAPFPGPSHWLMLQKFIAELLKRNHEVTAITSFTYKTNHTGYREILLHPPFDLPGLFSPAEMFRKEAESDFGLILQPYTLGIQTSSFALAHPKVQEFIRRRDQSFDLVISEQFFQDSFLMFAHKFKAPIVTISTYGCTHFMDRAMGLYTPLSFVPHTYLAYSDKMSFFQKFYSIILTYFDAAFRKFFYMRAMNSMANKYFEPLKRAGELPSIEELESTISAILINSHTSVSVPRPKMPGVIDIAGAHITMKKPLPEDLQDIMDASEEGVIYFSLGAYMKSSVMPPEKLKIFLDIFSKLKQTVLWKFESDDLPPLPKNVIVRKWMPQNDILAHGKIVLFISHGGLFGTLEAVHYAVPMLIMPFYADQKRNALGCQASGFANILNFKELNDVTLSEALNEMLLNDSYKEKAQDISIKFRDRLVPPMEEALYWIEYVIKHKGAAHLKSSAIHLNWFTYNNLDIFALVFGAFLILAIISYTVLDSCLNKKSEIKNDAVTNTILEDKEKRKKDKKKKAQ